MRLMICLTAAAALCACTEKAEQPANEANVADANATTAATRAAFKINETTWTFTDEDGQAVQESIDANGNYIANAGTKHIDHGTVVMKGDKACFTSAMDNAGEDCWTGPETAVEVGQSFETTSDKGEKLTVTRVAYVPMTMPQ